MIARIIILLLLLIVLPDIYIDQHILSRRKKANLLVRTIWWAFTVGMVVYALCLSSSRDFVPENSLPVDIFFLLLGVIIVPKAIFVICSMIGLYLRKRLGRRNNWGNLVGLILGVTAAIMSIYGLFIGPKQLVVRHVDLTFEKLPAAFDGYKVLHFSDLHIGSQSEKYLTRVADSINSQHADLICFTGDIQNLQPQELYPYTDILKSIKAPDGVFSVLGNHDYSYYVRRRDEVIRASNERETISRQRQYGWNVLLNENVTIRKGNDKIVIVGEENVGDGKQPNKVDAQKASSGVKVGDFVVLLQHNPKAWMRILSDGIADLTLSGHTHGGQASIFGLRPTRLTAKQDYGVYVKDEKTICVTGGVGGLLKFRLGVKPEIVLITLHKGNNSPNR